jgi:hypothetical protein
MASLCGWSEKNNCFKIKLIIILLTTLNISKAPTGTITISFYEEQIKQWNLALRTYPEKAK